VVQAQGRIVLVPQLVEEQHLFPFPADQQGFRRFAGHGPALDEGVQGDIGINALDQEAESLVVPRTADDHYQIDEGALPVVQLQIGKLGLATIFHRLEQIPGGIPQITVEGIGGCFKNQLAVTRKQEKFPGVLIVRHGPEDVPYAVALCW